MGGGRIRASSGQGASVSMADRGRRRGSIIKRLLLLVPVVASAVLLYHLALDDRFGPVVEGRVYRSAQLSPEQLQRVISERGIRTIINLRGRWKGEEWYEKEAETAGKNNVRLFDIKLSPHELPVYHKLISLLDVLATAERPLLIHCLRGSDRTGLVSALALSIELDPPLRALKEQFSFRYGVIPFFNRSVGPLLFRRYEEWLAATGRAHSRDTLLYWMKEVYTDPDGNLRFWIDTVNDRGFDDRHEAVIEETGGGLLIRGWAFDVRSLSPPEALSLTIDGRFTTRVRFRYDRPDVAGYFKLPEPYLREFPVGWEALFEGLSLKSGCHDVGLSRIIDGVGRVDITTDFKLCLKKGGS